MSKFINKGAVVSNKNAITYGRPCVIESYDNNTRKYEVSFDNQWCGHYYLNELTIDEPKDKPNE